MRDTVAHRFNKDWLSTILERHSPGFFSHFPYSEDVITVNADGIDAVTYTATSDAVAAVLLDGRGGDGEAVIPAEEDHRAGARSCYIESGVEITFASGTFAKVAGYDSGYNLRILEALELQCVSCSCGVGYLGSEGGGYGMLH